MISDDLITRLKMTQYSTMRDLKRASVLYMKNCSGNSLRQDRDTSRIERLSTLIVLNKDVLRCLDELLVGEDPYERDDPRNKYQDLSNDDHTPLEVSSDTLAEFRKVSDCL